jgi:hypothetical protein
MGLASIASHKLGGFLPVGAIFKASIAVGQWRTRSKSTAAVPTKSSIPRTPETAHEPSPLAGIQAIETFPHAPVETLPVLQINEKIHVSD